MDNLQQAKWSLSIYDAMIQKLQQDKALALRKFSEFDDLERQLYIENDLQSFYDAFISQIGMNRFVKHLRQNHSRLVDLLIKQQGLKPNFLEYQSQLTSNSFLQSQITAMEPTIIAEITDYYKEKQLSYTKLGLEYSSVIRVNERVLVRGLNLIVYSDNCQQVINDIQLKSSSYCCYSKDTSLYIGYADEIQVLDSNTLGIKQSIKTASSVNKLIPTFQKPQQNQLSELASSKSNRSDFLLCIQNMGFIQLINARYNDVHYTKKLLLGKASINDICHVTSHLLLDGEDHLHLGNLPQYALATSMGLFFGEFTEFNESLRSYEFQENQDESYLHGIMINSVVEIKPDIVAFVVDKRFNILIIDRAVRRLLREIQITNTGQLIMQKYINYSEKKPYLIIKTNKEILVIQMNDYRVRPLMKSVNDQYLTHDCMHQYFDDKTGDFIILDIKKNFAKESRQVRKIKVNLPKVKE
ncbi:UNKNOWN [Stylonychia lemnae]|uniref:Uncharacterized protein n=1 Tax=Stylonychia lemnae TaxID=5949 RepID=A0A077ZS83_STYLE|nr:UNKNOWN [Stylonychia lemnae]|eukprot:CDW72374.1 UNKNOWN [Stylonychia lemnae]